MNKVKELNFSGNTIYCGIDVHKTNWKINCRMEGIEIASFSQDADGEQLKRYMSRNYPGAEVKVVYEAGFSGYGIQRSLSKLGIECIIVNAADVPASDKERKRKDDKRDARRLCRELSEGNLRGIYIPDPFLEHARSLVRQRRGLQHDQVRCQNRIKHLLMFSGVKIEGMPERWSQKYIDQLQRLVCETDILRKALDLAIGEYIQIRKLLKEATLAIRELSKQEPFVSVQKYLQSIDGVGLISGMVIQTEIQDIGRFKTLDKLSDYAGFVPDIYSSNDKMVVKGITRRCNVFLRETIIESSWMLIRKDPAMLLKYNEYRKRMNGNKAIVRVGKHLLSRIRYVWKNRIEYERGIVQ